MVDEHIHKLIKLALENPGMEIIASVGQEITGSDEYRWLLGCITYVEKELVYQPDEFIFLGKHDILAQIESELENLEDSDKEISDEIAKKKFDELVKEGSIKDKIIIYIGA